MLTGTIPASDFSLSAGGGAYFGGHFTRYSLSVDCQSSGNAVKATASQHANHFNFGGFLFLDGTWAVFSLGFHGGNSSFREVMTVDSSVGRYLDTATEGIGREMMFTLALLGKYPFTLNERFTVFPLAGIEYQISMRQRRQPDGRRLYSRTNGVQEVDANGKPYKMSAWNAFMVNLGGGLDIALTSPLFLRMETLYAIRLQTNYEKDALEKTKIGVNATDRPRLRGLSSGPTLRIAVGWRFF